jgi:hypothetical protein
VSSGPAEESEQATTVVRTDNNHSDRAFIGTPGLRGLPPTP